MSASVVPGVDAAPVLEGGAEQPDIKLYRAISQEDASVMAEKIAGYRAEGYTKCQLKVGGGANDDIARIVAHLGAITQRDTAFMVHDW